ncbi:UDP-N-acetylmuramoyl-tripeptide--D-alanyl-D-alanine ligase [Tepidicella baoligensis]|uniref:UDP-N-acetylmuramoyl-tripeptide--D-alanyl-D- alanine ligase n=1 Tax=Tepidicella baoligensis TaxID=2707016 RepID=UPI0015DA683D|nr:UDP-N-acetylmuramoyl-tripeptide--D-alanyl-D-alanine ligase [Tepidicella baoligensis]
MNTLAELLPLLSGARVMGSLTAPIERVHTDTRSLRPGDLFVALRGERFDANDLLVQAKAAGAVGAVAERGLGQAGLGGVEVPDARRALGELAAIWRRQFHLPLVAVTGSNGKTTVTQMITAILRAAVGDAALATQGNFNNDIGVPLTLLRLRPSHRLAVLELGMNHPGEIAALAAMVQPSVVLVNNAQREHQEFMASVEAVARENASAFDALPAEGVAVFPAGDAYSGLWRELAAGRKVLTFSDADQQADVFAQQAVWVDGAWSLEIASPAGAFQARVRVAGRHNARNALAATACALAVGIAPQAIARGLSSFEAVAGRSRTLPLALDDRTLTLVDDSYNANPDSVCAAIDVLAELPAPRVLALGDMGEVGDQGLVFHDEVLRHALDCGIEHVLVTGAWMVQAAAGLAHEGAGRLRSYGDIEPLIEDALALLPTAGSVLVKGSRFMRMERLVQALQGAGGCVTTQEGASHAA